MLYKVYIITHWKKWNVYICTCVQVNTLNTHSHKYIYILESEIISYNLEATIACKLRLKL